MTNSIEKEILIDVLNNPGDTFYENVLSDFLDEQGVEHDFRKQLRNNTIKELKLYQEKCLVIWANHWINIGLCIKPTDEGKVEQCFCDFYKKLGFSTPKNIVWFNNPVELCSQISNWNQVRSRIYNQINNQVINQINNRVINQVRSQVWYQVWNKVWNKVWYQVWRRVWNQVWNQVWDQTGNPLLNEVWHGQQDAYWLAYYAYCMQVLRVEAPKQFVPLILLAQEVNWWLEAEQAVYFVRKPKECIVENGELVKLVYQDNYTPI